MPAPEDAGAGGAASARGVSASCWNVLGSEDVGATLSKAKGVISGRLAGAGPLLVNRPVAPPTRETASRIAAAAVATAVTGRRGSHAERLFLGWTIAWVRRKDRGAGA